MKCRRTVTPVLPSPSAADPARHDAEHRRGDGEAIGRGTLRPLDCRRRCRALWVSCTFLGDPVILRLASGPRLLRSSPAERVGSFVGRVHICPPCPRLSRFTARHKGDLWMMREI
jgi:hypothetical protein